MFLCDQKQTQHFTQVIFRYIFDHEGAVTETSTVRYLANAWRHPRESKAAKMVGGIAIFPSVAF